jgi:hypothetical protein
MKGGEQNALSLRERGRERVEGRGASNSLSPSWERARERGGFMVANTYPDTAEYGAE